MKDSRDEDDGKGGTLKGPMSTSGSSQGNCNTADTERVPDPLGLTKKLKDNK